MEIKGKGGGETGDIESAQGGLKKGGKARKGGKERKEEKRKGKIHNRKKGGIRGYSGGKAESIAMISKSRILMLVVLGKSIHLNSNF